MNGQCKFCGQTKDLREGGSCEDIRLQVFHPKDFTPIQYKELKQLVLTELDKLKSSETLTHKAL